MSFKYEVQVVNESKWCSNGVAFATKEEAETAAFNKLMVWTAMEDYRVVESDEPANYRWDPEKGLVHIEGAP